MQKIFKVALAVAITASIFSCTKKGEYETTKDGLQYKFHTKGEGVHPKKGDFIKMNLTQKTDADSLLSYRQDIVFLLSDPLFKGSIEEGISLTTTGDSVTFLVSTDSLFEKAMHQPMPPYLKKGGKMKIIIKVTGIFNKEIEAQSTKDYISKNNITVKPTGSGLYFIEKSVGAGVQPVKGDSVYVNYTGTFLDGKEFDSSDKAQRPAGFIVGVSQIIPAWQEAMQLMKEGGKAELILPSSLGFGEHGAQPVIPPYAALRFDMELIKVVKGPFTEAPPDTTGMMGGN